LADEPIGERGWVPSPQRDNLKGGVNHPRLKPVGLPLAPPQKGESEAIGLLTWPFATSVASSNLYVKSIKRRYVPIPPTPKGMGFLGTWL